MDVYEMPPGFHNYMIRELNRDAENVVSKLNRIERMDKAGKMMTREEFIRSLDGIPAGQSRQIVHLLILF